MKPNACLATSSFLQVQDIYFHLRIAVMKPSTSYVALASSYSEAHATSSADKFEHTRAGRRSGPQRQWQLATQTPVVPHVWFRQKNAHTTASPVSFICDLSGTGPSFGTSNVTITCCRSLPTSEYNARVQGRLLKLQDPAFGFENSPISISVQQYGNSWQASLVSTLLLLSHKNDIGPHQTL
jgi:hypothetical protein